MFDAAAYTEEALWRPLKCQIHLPRASVMVNTKPRFVCCQRPHTLRRYDGGEGGVGALTK